MITQIPNQSLYEFSQAKIPYCILKKHHFKDDFHTVTLKIPDQFIDSAEFVVNKLKEKYKRVRI